MVAMQKWGQSADSNPSSFSWMMVMWLPILSCSMMVHGLVFEAKSVAGLIAKRV